jgi:hypothetical protein
MDKKNDTAADRRVAMLIRIYRAAASSGDEQLKHAASTQLSRHGITAKDEIRTEPRSTEVQDA